MGTFYFLPFLGKEAVPNKSMLSALQFSISLPEKNKEPVLNDQEKKTKTTFSLKIKCQIEFEMFTEILFICSL